MRWPQSRRFARSYRKERSSTLKRRTLWFLTMQSDPFPDARSKFGVGDQVLARYRVSALEREIFEKYL